MKEVERKWFPYDDPQEGIMIDHLARIAGLVRIDDFDKHSDVTVIVVGRHQFLRFSDGSVSVPIQFEEYASIHRASVPEFAEAGVLTLAQYNEIVEEKDALLKQVLRQKRQQDRDRFVDKIRSKYTNPLRLERRELNARTSFGLEGLERDEVLAIHQRLVELEIEIERIEKIPIKKLLTAEEYREYRAI